MNTLQFAGSQTSVSLKNTDILFQAFFAKFVLALEFDSLFGRRFKAANFTELIFVRFHVIKIMSSR